MTKSAVPGKRPEDSELAYRQFANVDEVKKETEP
jgi:hypothetical protein